MTIFFQDLDRGFYIQDNKEEQLLYTVQNNVMYKYTFYHALYSVRVSISYYVLHVAMLVLLIDYSSKYKSYASEPSLYSGTATHACFGSTFPAAGCECIHLTRVHVHCTGILLIFAHCTDTDARVMVQSR